MLGVVFVLSAAAMMMANAQIKSCSHDAHVAKVTICSLGEYHKGFGHTMHLILEENILVRLG